MATGLTYVKGGTVIQCDTSKLPRPRPRLSYPVPVFPGTDQSLLVLQLQAVAQTGRTGVRVSSAASPLPGSSAGLWTLLWMVYQGETPDSPTWNSVPFSWPSLSLLLDNVMPSGTFVAYLQRLEAGQTYTYAQASISTPADPSNAISYISPGANLVMNGDSEAGLLPGYIAGNHVWDTGGAGGYGGTRYVRRVCSAFNGQGENPTYGISGDKTHNVTGRFPVTPGDTITLSVQIRSAAGDTGLNSGVGVYYYDADGNWISGYTDHDTADQNPAVTPAPGGPWILQTCAVQVPPGAAKAQAFLLLVSHGTFDFYLDDISVTRIPIASAATPTTAGVVKAGEGFSVAKDGTLAQAPATVSTLGGVKVGSGLTVDPDGTLHVTAAGGSGTVTSVSVAPVNGFAATVANQGTTPTLTLSTTVTGILKGLASGALASAVAGTDFLLPGGSGAALTGITAAQVGALPLTGGNLLGPLSVGGTLTVNGIVAGGSVGRINGTSILVLNAAAGQTLFLNNDSGALVSFGPGNVATINSATGAFSGTSATFGGILQLDGAVSSYVPAIQINWPGVNRLGIGPESATVWKVGLATGGAWSGNTGSWALHVSSSAAVALQVDGGIQTGGTLTTPYAATFQHYQGGWGDNSTRIWLNKGWTAPLGDYLFLCGTGNNSNANRTSLLLSMGAGLTVGCGSDTGDSHTGSPWFQVTPAGAGYLNGSPILTVANVGTNAATLQAAVSSATASSVGTSTQMYAWVPPSGLYPYFYATDLVNTNDGSMGALYRWNGAAWAYQNQPQVITPKLLAGNISAGAIGALAVSANDIRSGSYSAGTSTVPPTGIRLSGNAFTVTLLDGTTINAVAEIGGDVSIGGCKAAVVANRTMGNTVIQTGTGSINVVIPEGITSIVLTIQAAGGNGGGGYGSGGGAGTYYQQRIAVKPHNTYRLTIGAPGSNSTFAWVSWDGTLASDSGFVTITVACGVAGSTSSSTGASGYDGTIAQDPETGWANVPATGGDGASYGYGSGKGGSGGSCGNHHGGAGATTTVNKTTSGGGGAASVMGDGGSGSLTGFNGQPGGTGAGGGGGLAGGAGGPGFGRCQW